MLLNLMEIVILIPVGNGWQAWKKRTLTLLWSGRVPGSPSAQPSGVVATRAPSHSSTSSSTMAPPASTSRSRRPSPSIHISIFVPATE